METSISTGAARPHVGRALRGAARIAAHLSVKLDEKITAQMVWHWGRTKRIRVHKFGANIVAFDDELDEDLRR